MGNLQLRTSPHQWASLSQSSILEIPARTCRLWKITSSNGQMITCIVHPPTTCKTGLPRRERITQSQDTKGSCRASRIRLSLARDTLKVPERLLRRRTSMKSIKHSLQLALMLRESLRMISICTLSAGDTAKRP